MFLKLDRALHNNAVMMRGLNLAEENADVADQRLKRVDEQQEDVSNTIASGLEKELDDYVRVSGEASVAKRNREQARINAEVTYNGCIRILDDIAVRLAAITREANSSNPVPTRTAAAAHAAD